MHKHTVEYTILLEVQNIGKNPARNCYAEFDVKSQKEVDLPPWGVLDWIYPDDTRKSVGNLSYKGRARIELVKLTVTETVLSKGQTSYEYKMGRKFVAEYVSNQQSQTVLASSEKLQMSPVQGGSAQGFSVSLELIPLGIYKISIYGDHGIEKHGEVKVELKSKPHVEPIVET